MRTKKEINKKINQLYSSLQMNEIEPIRTIIYTDALCWVLGDDYLDEYKLVGKNKTSFIVGEGKVSIDHQGLHYKGTRKGEYFELNVGYKELYTLINVVDSSFFSFYYKGEYFDVFPKHQTVGKFRLLVEEMHRYHINFYKNFKWNDWMYEGMELGIDLK